MQEENNGLKIAIFIFCFICLILIFCNFIIFYKNKKEMIGTLDKDNNPASVCVKNVSSLEDIKPVNNCLMTKVTYENFNLEDKKINLKAIFTSNDTKHYKLSLSFNDEQIDNIFEDEEISTYMFTTFKSNNNEVLIIYGNNEDKCSNNIIGVIDNDKKILLLKKNIILESVNNSLVINETNYCSNQCSNLDYYLDTYEYGFNNNTFELLNKESKTKEQLCSNS